MKETTHTICILIEALGKGGAERSAGLLSQLLENLGHNVFLVTITDVVEYPHGGTLINLGKLKNKTNDPYNKFTRLLNFRSFLKKQNIEFIIDFRQRQRVAKEFLIARYLYKDIKVIYAVRSAHLPYYFPKSKYWSRHIFKQSHAVVTLTQKIKNKIQEHYNLNNVWVIPNFINPDQIKRVSTAYTLPQYPYIIASGRMDNDIKQYDKLLTAYAQSILPQQGIHLVIMGRGKLIKTYKNLAHSLGIQDLVKFKGFEPNPYPYYAQALFMVHCSKFEGFPMVILESLACGRPVIAMDCPTGPSELISDNYNGFLLKANDFKSLTVKLSLLIKDTNMLDRFAQNSVASIQKFDRHLVAKQWQNILKYD